MSAAIDNDVLLKGACYNLLSELIQALPSETSEVSVLGAARFVLRGLLHDIPLQASADAVWERLENFLEKASVIEPTATEVRLAAEFELAAQQSNVDLNGGESQLCAVVINRALKWLVTGDKRAIVALERIYEQASALASLEGKAVCLEQLFHRLLNSSEPTEVRRRVCSEPHIDRAISICFSCSSAGVGPKNWFDGLSSYISDLRGLAPRVLAT